MRHLAIIPARGGSKRIPNKNIKILDGKPLLVHSIEFARKSKFFDRIILSTDSSEIARIATQAGAEVPFMRPAALAEDHVPDKPVVEHCIRWLEENETYTPDLIWYLKPTNPFRLKSDLLSIEKTFIDIRPDSIRSVNKVQSHAHPYWMFKKNEDGFAQSVVEGIHIKDYFQRQLLPPVYTLNGIYEVINPKTISQFEYLFGEKIWLYETTPEISIDIDTPEDFQAAEKYLKDHDKTR